ncbi:MAG: NPCBM/NEW2 domain-containing protein [Bacteroidaceae bacterium]|nr:NPCBM/NEW2 domain-containing protein [Bacteroidaceae bacterium]
MKRFLSLLSLVAVMTAAWLPATAQTTVTPPATEDGLPVALLGQMDLTKTVCGWGTVHADKSIEGNPLTLGGTVYTSGVGTHATAQLIVKLNGSALRFRCVVGIDDETDGLGNVDYTFTGQGENGLRTVIASGNVKGGGTPADIDLDVNGFKYLFIDLAEGENNWDDHVDLANARFLWQDDEGAASPPVIVSADEIAEGLACATRVFSQPGVRFMHRLKASSPDAVLSVSDLPAGLTWNARKQRVEGVVSLEGVYTYNVQVDDGGDVVTEPVTLTVSRSLVQPVPFMGWLSWNVFEEEIDEEKMLAVASAAKRYGLDTLGYRYLCLDDWWHSSRERPDGGKPDYDHTKFPHGLAWLADSLHRMGFKIGIYSDAAEHTCAGAFGSYGYEVADAKQYAEWGMDLLKYDYCGAPTGTDEAIRRYKAMGDALKDSGRGILFYICEWGPREPWKWGSEVGGTCWRTTYDSRDFWDWGAKADGGHIGAIQGLDGMKYLWPYGGVNRFNDADMMMVGLHGTGKSSSHDYASYLTLTGETRYIGMTQEEYQSQFSLWAMLASPLTLSFDIRNISDDDLRIISNTEMIAINQDPMGQQAELVVDSIIGRGTTAGAFEVYVKELENGDVAVAVLNRGNIRRNFTVTPAMVGLDEGGKYVFHDVWGVMAQDSVVGDAGLRIPLSKHQTRVFRVTRADATAVVGTVLQPQSEPLKVTAKRGKLVIKTGDTTQKRVVVSDVQGHVVSTLNTASRDVTVSIPRGEAVYVVSVVGQANARTAKIAVKN